jgi:hypothetical protein
VTITALPLAPQLNASFNLLQLSGHHPKHHPIGAKTSYNLTLLGGIVEEHPTVEYLEKCVEWTR